MDLTNNFMLSETLNRYYENRYAAYHRKHADSPKHIMTTNRNTLPIDSHDIKYVNLLLLLQIHGEVTRLEFLWSVPLTHWTYDFSNLLVYTSKHFDRHIVLVIY